MFSYDLSKGFRYYRLVFKCDNNEILLTNKNTIFPLKSFSNSVLLSKILKIKDKEIKSNALKELGVHFLIQSNLNGLVCLKKYFIVLEYFKADGSLNNNNLSIKEVLLAEIH